jgi:hypothetical protein
MNRLVVCISIALSVLAGCTAAAPSAAPTQSTASTTAPVATLGPTQTPTPPATASAAATQAAPGAFGGIVHFQGDGATTTTVDAVADGASVSGTAVTASRQGTHTVRLGCSVRRGDIWVLGGTTEKSTIPGEAPGTWSAVIVKDGSPQQVAIWLSEDPSAASDCEAWLASFNPADAEPGTFIAVESGTLVPPPDPAP